MGRAWLIILGLLVIAALPFTLREPVAVLRGCVVAGSATAVAGLATRSSHHTVERYIRLFGAAVGVLVALAAWTFLTLASGFRPTP